MRQRGTYALSHREVPAQTSVDCALQAFIFNSSNKGFPSPFYSKHQLLQAILGLEDSVRIAERTLP